MRRRTRIDSGIAHDEIAPDATRAPAGPLPERDGSPPEPVAPAAARPVGSSTFEGLWGPSHRRLSVGLVSSVTLVAFEALAVGTVMPVVARDLDGLALYGWVFSAFFLGNLIGIVFAGQQIDRHGLARPYLIGLSLFAFGLIVGGTAPLMPVLVVARAIQGFGAGAIPIVSYVAIARSLPESARPRMFATLSTAWIVPGLVGPALAGLVADVASWRLVFLGLVPLLIVVGALVLPPLWSLGAAPAADARPRPTRRRLVDSATVAIGAGLVLSTSTLGMSLAGLAALVVGAAVALPALRRLLPAGALRARRGLPATILIRGTATFSFNGAEAFLPLALVAVRGSSATQAGVALTAATLSWTAGSWTQAHRMAAWGAPRLIFLGFSCLAVGIAGMAAVLLPGVPVAFGVVAWALAGFGMGLAYAPIAMHVLVMSPPAEQGVSTSSMQLSDVLGSALGTGLGGIVVALGTASGWSPGPAIGVAFTITTLTAIAGIGLSRRLRRPDGGSLPAGVPQ